MIRYTFKPKRSFGGRFTAQIEDAKDKAPHRTASELDKPAVEQAQSKAVEGAASGEFQQKEN